MPRRNSNVDQAPVYEAKRSRYITLEGRRLPIIETGGWSNKHWNVRRRAVLCPDCRTDKTGNDAATKLGVDLCPNFRCESARSVRGILRAERDDGSTKRYGVKKANTRSQGGSDGPVKRQKPVPRRRAPARPDVLHAVGDASGDGALAQAFRRAAKEAVNA